MRAVIAHCWTGTPEAGWYPAAAAALRAAGFEVVVPELPDSDSPDLAAWLCTLNEAIGESRDDLLLIGHSLGALAALHWLSHLPARTKIAGLFLIAPPLRPTGIPEVDRFLTQPPDMALVRKMAERAAVLVSDQDPYLLPDPTSLAKCLSHDGFEILTAPGKGHFSPASGLKTLPELVTWAERVSNVHS